MFILFLLVVLYIVSFIGAYQYIRISHSTEGQWSNISPDIMDLFLVICPIFNNIIALLYLTKSCYGDKHKKSDLLNKFFRINK